MLTTNTKNLLLDFLYDLTGSKNGHVQFAQDTQRFLAERFHYTNSVFLFCDSVEPEEEAQEDDCSPYTIQYLNRCCVHMNENRKIRAFQKQEEKLCQLSYQIIDHLEPSQLSTSVLTDQDIPLPDSIKALTAKHAYVHFVLMRFYCNHALTGALYLFEDENQGSNIHMKDTALLNTLFKYVDVNYRAQIEHTRRLQNTSLLSSSYIQAPIGMIILDETLNIYKVNDIATDYCRDIVEHGLPQLKVKNNIYHALGVASQVGQIISAVQDELNEQMSVEHRYYHTVSAMYEIKVIPRDLHKNDRTAETYYFMYITRHEDQQKLSLYETARCHNLTTREIDIVSLLEQGYNNMEIGQKLHISCNTVKAHISSIFRKMNVTSRTSLLYIMRNLKQKA